MRLTFCGAAGTVTGSCHLIETGNKKILLDTGMFQGGSEADEMNFEQFRFNPSEIDILILSHAHIDHSGRIPQLVKRGFKGKIISTAPTFELCKIMLPDSAFIQESETEWKNRKRKRAGKEVIEPLYTVTDAEASLKLFQPAEYNKIIGIDSNISIRIKDAGHILGSGIIEMWIRENNEEIKLLYSGDIGKKDTPILNDPSIIEEADYLIMESTYGDRLHREAKNSTLALLDIITDTIERNGNVVIPSFAVERTQEILYILNMLKECESSTICNIPVYVDSPLAINATGIFQSFLPYMDEDTQKLINKGDNPFEFPNLIFTHTAEESKAINTKEGSSIIISASGMCEAGRIKHHLKHNLWRKESSVVFVGYQAKNTLGRRIKDGEKLVKIFGEEISVNCNIYSIEGFSSHADQRGLIDWVGAFMRKPKKVFLVHGEEESSKVLSKLMESELGIPVEVAKLGETVELSEAAAREITAESKSMDKYDLISYLRSLKANSGDTLDSLEYIISEGSNVKNDSLLYHLKKLEESIAELKKEIS
ncbi:MAG TPA: MBL fold metallo-hydrolase [Bacillota bacterium]|jgi:metallo-beta-lactamase family protein|nr:MBL fold metallo-hydrolase [Bacillota bacterium]HQE66315.1 MBL fold metallo-hydrolase [Bacillota bacterium]HQJ36210.1 MBL fold metallo-hydrolase [Bacillota bacterium]HRS22269.1 MBL fold metallo-hydrolase [Clostridia bacterium]HRU41121.1 MBL fold metallo-hydrolase [Candidatus Diapherotrites archaeon]